MKEYLKYNLHSYLYKDKKKFKYLWFFPILTIFLFIYFSLNYFVYDVYETNAETLCNEECTLNFYYQIGNELSYDFIKINGKSYEIENIYFGNVELDSSNVGIQKITLEVKEYKGKNNEFVKLQIYKNKERFIKKIYKVIKER